MYCFLILVVVYPKYCNTRWRLVLLHDRWFCKRCGKVGRNTVLFFIL